MFEDRDMGAIVFDDEEEAMRSFERATVTWNCTLFATAEFVKPPPQLEHRAELLIGAPPRQCTCHRCIKEHDLKDTSGVFSLSSVRMILCPDCGNKRCPKASDHRLACTGSNEPGQVGSIFGPSA